jgi:Uncharacterized alpha/beta hydrolase domain (DUF2235)
MSEQNTPVGTNPSGSTAGVKRTIATKNLDAKKCEIAIHIGLFFDGTGNSRDGNGNTHSQWQHEAQRKHSNVARLFAAYPDDPIEGYFRMYVPGLGTPFPQIGEAEPAMFGNAGGEGGDGRVNYGLLHVFNAVHRAIARSQKPMFYADTVKALCRNGRRVKYTDSFGIQHDNVERNDADELKRVDMDSVGGLLMPLNAGRAAATTFYAAQSARLANLIANVVEKPRLKEIFIDVFGFSRGAAEARTFCSWLDKIFTGERLFGVIAHIRFVGLFDSVASVGINTSAGFGGEGHMSWADAPYLRIPARVKHCEHYVAMHENRPSFPLEFAEVGGVKPFNCRQFAYPGMHSDVGGGYFPDEQGRWIGPENFDDFGAKPPYRTAQGNRKPWEVDLHTTAATDETRVASNHRVFDDLGPPRPDVNDLDSRKVSQIALNHMYEAAKAANVPLDKDLALRQTGYKVFAVHACTQRAFNEFMSAAGGAKPLREWLAPYLAWRYQVRDRYASLATTRRASAQDRDDLQGANRTLLLDIDAVENAGLWQAIKDQVKGPLRLIFGDRTQRAAQLARESSAVLSGMKSQASLDAAAARMFMYLCHDSYAGFRPFDEVKPLGWDILPGSWEAEGYLRYRRRYEGDDRKLTKLEAPRTSPQSTTA